MGFIATGIPGEKAVFEIMKLRVNDYVADFGRTVGNELIIPTKIYTKACNAVMTKETVNGIIHITGGGFLKTFRESYQKDWELELI